MKATRCEDAKVVIGGQTRWAEQNRQRTSQWHGSEPAVTQKVWLDLELCRVRGPNQNPSSPHFLSCALLPLSIRHKRCAGTRCSLVRSAAPRLWRILYVCVPDLLPNKSFPLSSMASKSLNRRWACVTFDQVYM